MQSRDQYNNNTQKASIADMIREKKAFIAIGLLTLIVFAGAVFFLSRGNETSLPEDQIVARNGLHWHPKLSILIKGQKQNIPKDIGIGAIHQSIHTHEDDGIIHMEMQGVVTKDDTKLGNFFRIWGKKFSSSQIFEFKNSSDSAVKMLVNGKTNEDFGNYQMHDGDEIEIRYE